MKPSSVRIFHPCEYYLLMKHPSFQPLIHAFPGKVLAAHIRSEPHYAVLVDIRDRSPPQMVYVPQHLLIRYQLPQITASTPRAAFEQVHSFVDLFFCVIMKRL